MATIERNINGTSYTHEMNRDFNYRFIRNDDPNCYIKYKYDYEVYPGHVAIFIEIWVCYTTEPIGSGRMLMKDLFEYIKNRDPEIINDNTIVFLNPKANYVRNPRIPGEKRTKEKMIAYYKSINFVDCVIEKINLLCGPIGNIIQGITDYTKGGGRRKSKGRRKTKRSNKSKKMKTKRRNYKK